MSVRDIHETGMPSAEIEQGGTPHPTTGMAATNNPGLKSFYRRPGKDTDALMVGVRDESPTVTLPNNSGGTTEATRTVEMAALIYSAFSKWLPASSTGMPGQSVLIVGEDRRRQSATFVSTAYALIGTIEDLTSNSGMLIPPGQLFRTEVTDPIYACIPNSSDTLLQSRGAINGTVTSNAGFTAGINASVAGRSGYLTYINSIALSWDGSAAGALNTSLASTGLSSGTTGRMAYASGIPGSLILNFPGHGIPASSVGGNCSLFVAANANNPSQTLTVTYTQVPSGGALPGGYIHAWVERNF